MEADIGVTKIVDEQEDQVRHLHVWLSLLFLPCMFGINVMISKHSPSTRAEGPTERADVHARSQQRTRVRRGRTGREAGPLTLRVIFILITHRERGSTVHTQAGDTRHMGIPYAVAVRCGCLGVRRGVASAARRAHSRAVSGSAQRIQPARLPAALPPRSRVPVPSDPTHMP